MLKLQGICLKHTERGPRCLLWEVATIGGASLPVGRAVGQVRRGTAWEVMSRCPPSLPPTPFSLPVAAPRLNWAGREAWRASGQAVCHRGPEGTDVTAEVPLAGFVSSWFSHDTLIWSQGPVEGRSLLPPRPAVFSETPRQHPAEGIRTGWVRPSQEQAAGKQGTFHHFTSSLPPQIGVLCLC